ncbi:hypothetical protein [Kutzneria sp. 744]|uniref:hypothetical protein n=1 Tax=Kutzneria sp. (strain 744) TaxID=345341 RepID=UPI0003EEDAB4|nr:hypothetical protein [Kutzneria sp. 744]EWM19668.1 hypothetical protein KUTG_09972 [Kutzneria sp. 744]
MTDTWTIAIPETVAQARLAENPPTLDGIGHVTQISVNAGALRVSLTLTNGAEVTLEEDIEGMTVLDDENEVLEPDALAAMVGPDADPDRITMALDDLWLTVTTISDALISAVLTAVAPTVVDLLNTSTR